MGDMMSYLDWRGDLSFEQSPFNEVDNLILSQLAYVELDGIIPPVGSRRRVTVAQACEVFFRHHTEEEILASKSFIHMSPFILKKMAQTERFKLAKLYNYVNDIDPQKQIQFAAFHVALADGTVYVAFRGTDDTIVGWQEDFNMSFKTVPAQTASVEYLEATIKGRRKNYILGGHSKGGNLAIYAASMSSRRVQNRIAIVYNNDGPGFTKEILAVPGYLAMAERVRSFSPEHSVIGRLLEHDGEFTIVASSAKGILQHDAMTWEVLGNHFVYRDAFTKQSDMLDDTLKKWLSNLNDQQKEEFVDNLFSIMGANGAETITDIANSGIKKLGIILKSFGGVDDATKDVITTLIKLMTTEYHKEYVQPLLEKIIPAKKGNS
ncbi:MAG: DUF2974 domain-containing protein [Hespellia sp.]|nr:DUF2974 domain-containing protein [Hespellia sp.]